MKQHTSVISSRFCNPQPSSLGINIGENKDRIRSLVNVSRLRSLKEVEAASSVKAATAKPAESSTNQTDGGSSEGVLIPAKGVSRHTKSEQFSIGRVLSKTFKSR